MGNMVYKLSVIIVLAPFVSGIITKIKNNLRMRQGQGILQPYRNLWKLFGKENTFTEASSWIFKANPYIAFATSVTAVLLFVGGGNLLAIIFVLALQRFFLALAALDCGSPFGGTGSSREMFLSSFVEPAAFLIIFAMYLTPGPAFSLSHILTGVALLIVVIAETGRLPVDNQETHLELTMIHEAMLLDYTGPSLALLEWSAQIKQLFWLCLLAGVMFPITPLTFVLAILGLTFVISMIEITISKYRLFKVPDLIMFGLVMALFAIISALLGV